MKKLTEYEIQRDFIKAARKLWPEILIHADSSGVRQSIGAAKKMKNAGRIAGWPDVFIPVWNMGSHGLFIEFKTEKGEVKDHQIEIHDKLKKHGYTVKICRSAASALYDLSKYLSVNP